MIKTKMQYFKYFLYKILKYQLQSKVETNMNSVRLQKLLFLVCSIHANENEHRLLDIFNSFYSSKFGPFEKDIQYLIENNKIYGVEFEQNVLLELMTETGEFDDLDKEIMELIDKSFETLFKKNKDYLSTDIFDLIQRTQAWSANIISNELSDMFNEKYVHLTTQDIIDSTKE